MEKRILAVGGDRRQTLLARRLTALGRVDTLLVPELPDSADGGPYDLLILPCPSLDENGMLRGPEPLDPAALLSRIGPETRCYGGGLAGRRDRLPGMLQQAADLLADPQTAAANGRLTAEAAAALTLLHTEDSLAGQRCLVLGWGWIGRPLSLLLRNGGAQVRVAVRRTEAAAQAEGLGLEACVLPEFRGSCSIVFNTVPAPVLTEAQLRGLGSCLWVELASAPYGLPQEVPAGIRLLPAGGLPGKYLPRAAAEILYQGILRLERCVL